MNRTLQSPRSAATYQSREPRVWYQTLGTTGVLAVAIVLTGCAGGSSSGCSTPVYSETCHDTAFGYLLTTQQGTSSIDTNKNPPAVNPSFTLSGPDPFQYVNWGPWAQKNVGTATVEVILPGHFGSSMTFNGQVTAVMPQTGSAMYAGRALGSYPSDTTGANVQGIVTVNANFGKYTVDVNIFNSDGHTLTYGSAYIYPNGGTSYSNFSADGSRTLYGAFFGPNAEETSGNYSWTSPSYSINGTFGARRCAAGATLC